MGFFSSASEKSKKAKIKVLREESCSVTLSISVFPERIQEETEKAFDNIRERAKIPGFRPGKAPLDVVRKNFSDLASQRARDSILQQAVQEAISSQALEPVQPPVVKGLDYKPGESLSFELQVERAPRFELKSYKGFKIEKKRRSIDDSAVASRLEEIRESNAKLVKSEKTKLKLGHFAVVDYEGFFNGVPVAGAKGSQVLIDTANPQMISGLAEGILGIETNQTKEIPVKFSPDSPSKELAGKEVTFKVVLHAIKEKSLPALDDEFAKDLGCTSLEDLKARVQKSLEESTEREARDSLEQQITEKILQEHDFKVPPSLLEERVQYQMGREKDRWTRAGGRPEEWPQAESVVRGKVQPACERQLRLAYLIREISRRENVQVDDKEVTEAISKIIETAPVPERARLEQILVERRDEIASDLRNRKVFDFLIGQAKIKEVI